MLHKLSFTLLIFLALSCGKTVNISQKELEEASKLESSKSLNTGTLRKTSSSSEIEIGGKAYKVSMYSSYQALEFIAARPIGATISVKYKGDLKTSEIVLQTIEAN